MTLNHSSVRRHLNQTATHIKQNSYQKKILLFSPHISYGKGKYLNQTGFFLQNLPRFYLYLNLRVLPIEFNPHKFSFVRYVFVEIFEVFLKNDENDPLMTK